MFYVDFPGEIYIYPQGYNLILIISLVSVIFWYH